MLYPNVSKNLSNMQVGGMGAGEVEVDIYAKTGRSSDGIIQPATLSYNVGTTLGNGNLAIAVSAGTPGNENDIKDLSAQGPNFGVDSISFAVGERLTVFKGGNADSLMQQKAKEMAFASKAERKLNQSTVTGNKISDDVVGLVANLEGLSLAYATGNSNVGKSNELTMIVPFESVSNVSSMVKLGLASENGKSKNSIGITAEVDAAAIIAQQAAANNFAVPAFAPTTLYLGAEIDEIPGSDLRNANPDLFIGAEWSLGSATVGAALHTQKGDQSAWVQAVNVGLGDVNIAVINDASNNITTTAKWSLSL